jgi:hypothetical protein
MKGSFKSALIGRDGMLRPIWRAAIFYAVGSWLIFPVPDRLFNFVAGSLHLRPGFTAANVGLGELLLNFTDASDLHGRLRALRTRPHRQLSAAPSSVLSAGRHLRARLPDSSWRVPSRSE